MRFAIGQPACHTCANARRVIRINGIHIEADVQPVGIPGGKLDGLLHHGSQPKDTNGLHISFDMDAVDPDYAPGVGTRVAGGLTYREAHLSLELIADSGKMTSLEIVEVNPPLDHQNRTPILASELIPTPFAQPKF